MGIRPGAQPRMTFHFRYRQGFLPALRQEPGNGSSITCFPSKTLSRNGASGSRLELGGVKFRELETR